MILASALRERHNQQAWWYDSLGIDDDFSESENEHENGETIQANPETCWPTVPAVNKKNEPPPKKLNPKWKIATFMAKTRITHVWN
jgi:hypothetical protein